MAMSTTILVATALAGVNALFLLALSAVWLRNYRTFRSTLVLGLLAFAVVLFVENALAVYFFLGMRMLYSGDPTVQTAVAVLRALQFAALAFLTWATLR